MELSRDEKILLLKFRRAKKYAQENKQAEINICILPGGRVFITKNIFQEKIEIEQTLSLKG